MEPDEGSYEYESTGEMLGDGESLTEQLLDRNGLNIFWLPNSSISAFDATSWTDRYAEDRRGSWRRRSCLDTLV